MKLPALLPTTVLLVDPHRASHAFDTPWVMHQGSKKTRQRSHTKPAAGVIAVCGSVCHNTAPSHGLVLRVPPLRCPPPECAQCSKCMPHTRFASTQRRWLCQKQTTFLSVHHRLHASQEAVGHGDIHLCTVNKLVVTQVAAGTFGSQVRATNSRSLMVKLDSCSTAKAVGSLVAHMPAGVPPVSSQAGCVMGLNPASQQGCRRLMFAGLCSGLDLCMGEPWQWPAAGA